MRDRGVHWIESTLHRDLGLTLSRDGQIERGAEELRKELALNPDDRDRESPGSDSHAEQVTERQPRRGSDGARTRGDRYARDRRHGLRISSVPAESAMSHLVNQRMGNHQPMRWSSEGAHLLLQVRCAVLVKPARRNISRGASELSCPPLLRYRSVTAPSLIQSRNWSA